MSDRTSWTSVLPSDKIGQWIVTIGVVIFIFWAGVGTGFMFCSLNKNSNFQGGASWMQQSYQTSGKVERVIITGTSRREKE